MRQTGQPIEIKKLRAFMAWGWGGKENRREIMKSAGGAFGRGAVRHSGGRRGRGPVGASDLQERREERRAPRKGGEKSGEARR